METYNKIINPRTKRAIYQYGPIYDELISKYKYTEEYLNSLPKIKSNNIPKSPKIKSKQQQVSYKNIIATLPDELINEIILNADMYDVINVCQSNTIFKNYCKNNN